MCLKFFRKRKAVKYYSSSVNNISFKNEEELNKIKEISEILKQNNSPVISDDSQKKIFFILNNQSIS
jgi:hypothetical protein